MGFRFIKEDQFKAAKNLQDKKLAQLFEEAQRWSNITENHNRKKEILNRICNVASQLDSHYKPEIMADAISQLLLHRKANLVHTQGNIELGKLTDLL